MNADKPLTWSPRCASCGKAKNQHRANTLECPRGKRTTAGYVEFSDERFSVLPLADLETRTVISADFNAGRHLRKRHKYGAKAVVVDGIRFPSKAEAKRDGELLLLERAGKITDLKRQPKFDLVVNGVKICGYRGDWSYVENGARVVEDRKGAITPAFKIKWALAKALYPDIEWRLS